MKSMSYKKFDDRFLAYTHRGEHLFKMIASPIFSFQVNESTHVTSCAQLLVMVRCLRTLLLLSLEILHPAPASA